MIGCGLNLIGDTLKKMLASISAFIGIVTFCFGLVQYRRAGVKALMEKFDHYERELAAGMKPRLLESRLKVSTAQIARSE